MSRLTYFITIFALLLWTSAIFALSVKSVEVEGAVRTERFRLINAFHTGELSEEEINDVLKKLYELKIYRNIALSYDDAKQILTVHVQEFPVIKQVVLKGYDNLDKDDIKEVLSVKKNELLDIEKLSSNANKIKSLYRDEGYLMVTVGFTPEKITEDTKSLVTVVFTITEGSKSRVKKINIEGNSQITDRSIKEFLQIKEHGVLSFLHETSYNTEMLEMDHARIMYLYNDQGYVTARVNKPIVTISPDKRNISITYSVHEGERYKVKSINIFGDKMDNGKYPRINFRQKTGKWYQHSRIIQDIDRVKARYGDQGYPFVTVMPDRKLDEKEKTVDLKYSVQKGDKCIVERIDFDGNSRSKDKVVRRYLRIYEGDLYSFTGEKRSEFLLRQSGFYDEVTFQKERGSSPGMVIIKVKVKERRSGTFNIGAGFSSFENFMLTARVDQNNFLGYGQNISLSAQFSKIRQEVSLNFTEPYLADRNVSLSAGAFYRRYNYDSNYYNYYADYSQHSFGFNFTFGFPLTDYLRLYTGYLFNYTNIEGATTEQMSYLFRDTRMSSLEVMLAWDSRNDRMFPSKGIYTLGKVSFAHKYLGASEDILKLSGFFRWYQGLFLGVVFKVNVEAGWNRELNNGQLPYAQRFRLGGINSIRGYPFMSIGPGKGGEDSDRFAVTDDGKDPISGQREYVIGGDKKFMVNMELEIPIVRQMRLNLVGFLDVGNTWAEDENFFYIGDQSNNYYGAPMGMFWSAGFGIRWVTPLAPLSFEWGFPLNPRPGDPKYMFEFNIKNSF